MLMSWVEQVYQDTTEYPHSNTFGNWRDDTYNVWVKTFMPEIPTDEKNWEACYGWSTCAFIYWVSKDSNGIEFWEYELSTAFENKWNIDTKANDNKDGWNDDFRFEIWIDLSDKNWTEKKPTSSFGEVANIKTPTCRLLSDPEKAPDPEKNHDEESIFLANDC